MRGECHGEYYDYDLGDERFEMENQFTYLKKSSGISPKSRTAIDGIFRCNSEKVIIQKLLPEIFPNELSFISNRKKNCRVPLNNLLFLIRMENIEIKNFFTQNILDQDMQICINLLPNTQRKQK